MAYGILGSSGCTNPRGFEVAVGGDVPGTTGMLDFDQSNSAEHLIEVCRLLTDGQAI